MKTPILHKTNPEWNKANWGIDFGSFDVINIGPNPLNNPIMTHTEFEAAELRELATMLKAHEESEQIEEVLWTAFALLEPLCEENPKVISCLRDLKLIADKVKAMPEMIAGLHSRYCALSDENGPCFCPACTIVYGTAGRPEGTE